LPYLAFLRDKGLMFSDSGDSFLMYGVQGRTFVVLGDPVGALPHAPALVEEFLERCDDFDGIPVFYQATEAQLGLYANSGLTIVKYGEEARVPLPGFALEGHAAKDFRQSLRRLEREGCTFRVAPAGEVKGLLGELEEVSDEWLRGRGAAEKGF